MTVNSSSISDSVSALVGSSMMSTSESNERDFAISTICCLEMGSRFSVMVGSIRRFNRPRMATASSFIFFSFRVERRVSGSLPMKMLAATDRWGMRLSSW